MEENNPNKQYYIPIGRGWTCLNREICILSDPIIKVITSKTHENTDWNPKSLFNGRTHTDWESVDSDYNFIEIHFVDPPTAFEIKADKDPANYELLSADQNAE